MSTVYVEDPERKALLQSVPRIPLTWLPLFLVLAALVLLVTPFLVKSISLSHRVDDLESRLAAKDAQVVNALLQLRVLSYWLAYDTSEPLILEPPSGISTSQGVFRIVDDGLSAILMVAGMQQLPPSSFYQVWVTHEGQRVQAAQLKVDPNGWGATTVYFEEPILGYDTIEVTAETAGGFGTRQGPLVLAGKIASKEDAEVGRY